MIRRALRWALLLLVGLPFAAWAGAAGMRVIPLQQAPAANALPQHAAKHIWLSAPGQGVDWHEITLAQDWHAASAPLLVVGGDFGARVWVRLPPDYRLRSDRVTDAAPDSTFSHRAVVFELPSDLRADMPLYVGAGAPGQGAPLQLHISDAASYRVADLAYIRINTFLVSVQLSMVLVIVCFWLVLRDRVFLHFIAYVSAEILYQMVMSGELFALPGGGWWTHSGFRLVQSMAPLATSFSIWFLLDFAELRSSTPRLARALRVLAWASLACGVLLWMPLPATSVWVPALFNPILLGACALALVAATLAWWRGNRSAGFFLLSWVPLLVLASIRVVQLSADLPLPAWLEYGFPGSMTWAALIITVGLADRMLQARRERDKATRLAQFDALTGVFNRRAIMEHLHGVWHSADATASPLAAAFLDLDHFKRINDSHGHAAGDACLAAVTAAIRAELGPADRLGRYGGEEFLIVLVGDSATHAVQLAERIVQRVAALRVGAGGKLLTLTVSIGVAARDADTASPEALVEMADAAQYQAKADGRNRVVEYQLDLPAGAFAR